MFDKIKQIQQAKAMQAALAQVKEEVEKQGVKVVLTGTMQLESVTLNPELENQEQVLKECFNEAVQKIQRAAASKMSELGGF